MRTPAFHKRLNRTRSGNLPPERSAHELGRRNDADSAEIQPVRIPARADRCIFMMMSVGVPCACVMEKFKSIVRNIENLSAQAGRKFRPACSMSIIGSVILASAVVKHRKQPDHIRIRTSARCKEQTILLHASPVGRAVNGILVSVVLACHKLPEFFEIDVHFTDDAPSVSPIRSSRSSFIAAKSRLTQPRVCI